MLKIVACTVLHLITTQCGRLGVYEAEMHDAHGPELLTRKLAPLHDVHDVREVLTRKLTPYERGQDQDDRGDCISRSCSSSAQVGGNDSYLKEILTAEMDDQEARDFIKRIKDVIQLVQDDKKELIRAATLKKAEAKRLRKKNCEEADAGTAIDKGNNKWDYRYMITKGWECDHAPPDYTEG